MAKREAVQQGQHFIAELDNGITITWTPDGSTDVLTPDTVLPENGQLDDYGFSTTVEQPNDTRRQAAL